MIKKLNYNFLIHLYSFCQVFTIISKKNNLLGTPEIKRRGRSTRNALRALTIEAFGSSLNFSIKKLTNLKKIS